MESQGRAGFSVEGLWEGTPREDRVTARAGRGVGRPVRGDRMESGGPWLGTRQRSGSWSRWRWATSGGNALFSDLRVNRSPTLTETTHTGRITDSAPEGSQGAIGLGRLPGPERHPHAPEAPSPPESAAGPEDLRAEAVPSREEASALSAQHREAPRRHLGGPATHRSEGPRNDSQCATSARIGGDAWASA